MKKHHLICFDINEMVSVSSIFYFLKVLEAVIAHLNVLLKICQYSEENIEAVVRRCSVKKCSYKFFKIHRKTSVNFAKFLRTTFFKEHFRRLLLNKPVLES